MQAVTHGGGDACGAWNAFRYGRNRGVEIVMIFERRLMPTASVMALPVGVGRFGGLGGWYVANVKLTVGATEYYLGAEEDLVTVKSSISLTDEQHAFARALVDAGRYSSLSAVLQQGADLLRQRMDAEELETAALRELLSRRRKGRFVGAEGMDARLAGMIADKRRAHGLPS